MNTRRVTVSALLASMFLAACGSSGRSVVREVEPNDELDDATFFAGSRVSFKGSCTWRETYCSFSDDFGDPYTYCYDTDFFRFEDEVPVGTVAATLHEAGPSEWDIDEFCVVTTTSFIAVRSTCDYDNDYDRSFEVTMEIDRPAIVFFTIACDRYVVTTTDDLGYFGTIDVP